MVLKPVLGLGDGGVDGEGRHAAGRVHVDQCVIALSFWPAL